MLRKCAFLCSCLVIALGIPQFADAAGTANPAHPELVQQALKLINVDRKSVGVTPLRTGHNLSRVALEHSLDMANHDYFAHNTPSGVSPFARIESAGLHFRRAGENIGTDAGAGQTAMLHAIERLMMNSPEHRANLLDKVFKRIGIGIATIGNRLYITEDFKN